ncbi:MAG: 23S rRNA pseudouridine synthase [Parcubacteria group bacterium Gr01-1014_56]|nr:MAG: 23S rRNA pseudouridine synthase [Parcubacteria group bacterium Gr01-1014_56]
MEKESAAWAGSEPSVIYEDKDIIVINKPAGLLVHADGKHERATLVDWLALEYPELKGVGEEQTLPDGTIIERPGIVHRIDADTSGVMVVARTQKAFEFLKKQFQNRETRKVYLAFVYGPLKDERGIIDKPIGSARGGKGPRSARTPHGTSRDAQTAYHVLKKNKEVSYVEAFPKTGRTHQIRVHFSAIQHPIICDKLYAPNRPALLGFTRLALHALSLSFAHPDGRKVTFTAPLPADFAEAEMLC